jgi:hypothetical protein
MIYEGAATLRRLYRSYFPSLSLVLNIQALQAENFPAGVNLPILNGGRLACRLRSRAGMSGVPAAEIIDARRVTR